MFRNYTTGNKVEDTYLTLHLNQTVSFVEKMREKWLKFDHGEYTVWEILEKLDNLVDESDPDTDVPNSIHDFQTAERIRETHPDLDWFHLVGLLHDIGKIMSVWGEPQWAVVGDTYPLGCAFSDKIVFSYQLKDCMDYPLYKEKLGIYKKGCGLGNVMMSWGHDEYLYQVLKNSGTSIPEVGLKMIRYHSFYPWHTEGAYSYLTDENDIISLGWIQEFNKFDLYSKSDSIPDTEMLKPYYQSLLVKYGLDGKIKF